MLKTSWPMDYFCVFGNSFKDHRNVKTFSSPTIYYNIFLKKHIIFLKSNRESIQLQALQLFKKIKGSMVRAMSLFVTLQIYDKFHNSMTNKFSVDVIIPYILYKLAILEPANHITTFFMTLLSTHVKASLFPFLFKSFN